VFSEFFLPSRGEKETCGVGWELFNPNYICNVKKNPNYICFEPLKPVQLHIWL
jgi:hypothetical protein